MATSIFIENKKILNPRIKRFFLLFISIFIFIPNNFAQPVWNSGPTMTPFPIHLELSFNLDRASNVYYTLVPVNYNPLPAPDAVQVKY
jgi:hypothetical protein